MEAHDDLTKQMHNEECSRFFHRLLDLCGAPTLAELSKATNGSQHALSAASLSSPRFRYEIVLILTSDPNSLLDFPGDCSWDNEGVLAALAIREPPVLVQARSQRRLAFRFSWSKKKDELGNGARARVWSLINGPVGGADGRLRYALLDLYSLLHGDTFAQTQVPMRTLAVPKPAEVLDAEKSSSKSVKRAEKNRKRQEKAEKRRREVHHDDEDDNFPRPTKKARVTDMPSRDEAEGIRVKVKIGSQVVHGGIAPSPARKSTPVRTMPRRPRTESELPPSPFPQRPRNDEPMQLTIYTTDTDVEEPHSDDFEPVLLPNLKHIEAFSMHAYPLSSSTKIVPK